MRTAVVIAALFACSSTSKTSQPPELVGAWTAAGAIGDPAEPGPAWTKTYTFDGSGSFRMEGYPPIQVTGKWKIAERDGNRFRLVLTEQQMRMSKRDEPSAWGDEDTWVVLEGSRLTWKDATYSKQQAPGSQP